MSEDASKNTDEIAARLGRNAARLVKQAGPRVKRLAADAKPLVGKAAQYAVDHQDEIKSAGAKVLRGRVGGPLGMAIDAAVKAANAAPQKAAAPSTLVCAKCSAENPPGSRFCNQCAAALGAQ